jgi:hypothetical protein
MVDMQGKVIELVTAPEVFVSLVALTIEAMQLIPEMLVSGHQGIGRKRQHSTANITKIL